MTAPLVHLEAGADSVYNHLWCGASLRNTLSSESVDKVTCLDCLLAAQVYHLKEARELLNRIDGLSIKKNDQ